MIANQSTILKLKMTSQLKARLILILSLFSLCHLNNGASYKQFSDDSQLKYTDRVAAADLVRIKLSKGNELDSFEALSRSHNILKNSDLIGRKPIGLNSQLVGSVEIGYPVQEFKLLFSTTCSNMWIPSLNCINCAEKKRYNSWASTTYMEDGQYTTFGWNLGFRSVDRVFVGDFVLKNLTFAEMLKIDDFLVDAPFDGEFCLGYDSEAKEGIVTPLRRMVDQGIIDHELFSIHQNSEGGEIVFGGYDQNHFEGSISWVPSDASVWAFRMESLTLKDSDMSDVVIGCASGCTVAISTFLPYILGPPKEVMAINKALGAELDIDYTNMFVLPSCNLSGLPNLVFKIKDTEYELTPEQYIQKVKKDDQVICVSSLHMDVLQVSGIDWVIGSSVVGHIYTVFDYEGKQLGFAHTK